MSRQAFYGRQARRAGGPSGREAAEAFFSSPKRELAHRHRYPDRATAHRSILERLARYNTHRHHTSLDDQTPDEHQAHYRQPAGSQPALSTCVASDFARQILSFFKQHRSGLAVSVQEAADDRSAGPQQPRPRPAEPTNPAPHANNTTKKPRPAIPTNNQG
ncbi:integrase core domain-containing protein [Candidatus Poriferisodalis sp.]|uniref:integrase core domain-containing protein n=1 Tax=Candidatus Poriferisodalis sp. TaxID=3101277 RepID=UPI003B011B38